MAETKTRKAVLEPIERISEVLFGLIMVLTFTCSLSVAESGRAEVRAMLYGALGCNIAWGLIDAIMYLMGRLSERGAAYRTVRAVRQAANDAAARHAIAAALPAVVAEALEPRDFDKVHAAIVKLPEPPPQPRLERDDWRGAGGVFLLVVLAIFPATLPFVLIGDAAVALRVSNAVAIVLLSGLGYAFGKLSGCGPLLTAGAMVILGVAMVALAIALGG